MGESFAQNFILYTLYIWSLFWKGIALWRASHYKQRNWFVVMLVLNTIGILEIIYLLRFSKKRLTLDEVKSWKNVFIKKVPEKSS
jgi:methionyl-tRNA synthetase